MSGYVAVHILRGRSGRDRSGALRATPALAALILALWAGIAREAAAQHGPFHRHRLAKQEEALLQPRSPEEIAKLLDHIDKELQAYGRVLVKSPDVYGQNRLTQYKIAFEDAFRTKHEDFQLLINSSRRTRDFASLVSILAMNAALPGGTKVENNGNRNFNMIMPGIANNPLQVPAVAGNQLTAPGLPALRNFEDEGIGLEPTIAADEEARFLNHVFQLRRTNSTDDRHDLPGYGLYMLRVPVSILPGAKTLRGRGAVATLSLKHDLSSELLPVTFKNVLVLETTYLLKALLIDQIYFNERNRANRARGVEGGIETPGPAEPLSRGNPGDSVNAAGYQSARLDDADRFRPRAMFPPPTPTAGNASMTDTQVAFDAIGNEQARVLVIEAIEFIKGAAGGVDSLLLNWLSGRLDNASRLLRDQALAGNPHLQPPGVQRLRNLVLGRRYVELASLREEYLGQLKTDRGAMENSPDEILSFVLMVQAAYLDQLIKTDMAIVARRVSRRFDDGFCSFSDPSIFSFMDPIPTEEARAAFADYVAAKWPIHVFTLDPMTDQQNQIDILSLRTDLQLALAIGIANGTIDAEQVTTFSRSLERELAAIDLNRTVVGFGAGEATFGWRFSPRIQTPPIQTTPRRAFSTVFGAGGLSREYDLNNRQIEPGPRECTAIVVAPNFVPRLRMTSTTNWFDLANPCADELIENADMMRLSRKARLARVAFDNLYDSHKYRPGDLEWLSDRLDQIEAQLPMNQLDVQLPFEGDLLASEMFDSTNSALKPRLLAWYGDPVKQGEESSVFLYGNGFHITEMKVIVGGVNLPQTDADDHVDSISYNTIRIKIPANARPIRVNGVHPKETRLVYPVYVATPNGISNPLLIETQPRTSASNPPPATAARPQFALQSPSNRIMPIYFRLDDDRVPRDGRVREFDGAPPPKLVLRWTDAAVPAVPRVRIDAEVAYPGPGPGDPPALRVVPLTKVVNRGASSGGSDYEIPTEDLENLARQVILGWNRIGNPPGVMSAVELDMTIVASTLPPVAPGPMASDSETVLNVNRIEGLKLRLIRNPNIFTPARVAVRAMENDAPEFDGESPAPADDPAIFPPIPGNIEEPSPDADEAPNRIESLPPPLPSEIDPLLRTMAERFREPVPVSPRDPSVEPDPEDDSLPPLPGASRSNVAPAALKPVEASKPRIGWRVPILAGPRTGETANESRNPPTPPAPRPPSFPSPFRN